MYKMKISLLISAEVGDSYGFNILASQLAQLRYPDLEVQQIYVFQDYSKTYTKRILEQLLDLCAESDLIGISLLSSVFRNSIQITEAVRSRVNCPIIWGGKHPTIAPDDCLEYADMVCVGEGEDTFCELVSKMYQRRPIDAIAGLWIKKRDSIVRNSLRSPETNLDRFLFPDYSLTNKYVLDEQRAVIRPLQRDDLLKMSWYPTMITRGCPNFCTFCINSVDKRLRQMRWRSVDSVLKEIREFRKSYPEIKQIFFRDDCLSAMSLPYLKELCQRYKEEINLPASLSGVIATSSDFREKVALFTQAGFINLKMGIQSGAERVRTKVFARVGETEDVIRRADRVLHEESVGEISYYMITDNPYETEAEKIQSIRFTSTLARPFALSLYSLNFYPGTAIYNKAMKDRLLADKERVLLKSTMEFQDTYLNKVFLSLRYFEIPPFIVNILTTKGLFENKVYQQLYNLFFELIFGTRRPTRWIKKPTGGIGLLKQRRFIGFVRWGVWRVLDKGCQIIHRATVRNNSK